MKTTLSSHRKTPQSGVTLIEILIAVSLLSLLSVGILMAMRIGFNTMEKTDVHLVQNRRVSNARKIIENEIAGFTFTRAEWRPAPEMVQIAPFTQWERQSMRFVTAYSLQDAWRGRARIVAFQVIPGDRGGGVRLIVNETPYTGPAQAGQSIASIDQTGVHFAPILPGAQSFVLADRLAFCRFSYLEPRGEPPLRIWRPDWIQPGLLPLGIRIEMAPLDNTPAELHVATVTVPLNVNRDLNFFTPMANNTQVWRQLVGRTRSRGTAPPRRGSALLTVLWLTAALSAIGLAVANNVRGETERASTNVDDTKSYFIARGAIERAALRMQWGKDYFQRGAPSMELAFPTAQVRVEIIPETSKLGLNQTLPEDLFRLLIALGVPEDRATGITAAIVDWRTPVTPLHPSPFDPFYLAQSPSFLPRHTSFLENEELLLVNGITPDLYFGTSLDNTRAGLRDCVSVFGSGAVDINTARAETLVAVGLSPADAATIVQSRAQHPVLDSQQLADIRQSLGPAGARLSFGGQTMYTLRAIARLRRPDGKLSDLRRTVAALVEFNYPGKQAAKVARFRGGPVV